MGMGVLVPYLVGLTVDDIGQGGADLWPLAIAVAGAGVLRLVFSVVRRLVAGQGVALREAGITAPILVLS